MGREWSAAKLRGAIDGLQVPKWTRKNDEAEDGGEMMVSGMPELKGLTLPTFVQKHNPEWEEWPIVPSAANHSGSRPFDPWTQQPTASRRNKQPGLQPANQTFALDREWEKQNSEDALIVASWSIARPPGLLGVCDAHASTPLCKCT